MSLLVITLPPRPPLADAAQADEPPAAWTHVHSEDGRTALHHGRLEAAHLPRCDQVVAVLPPERLSWHALTLPKAPAARLREALLGLLEEQLLDEAEAVHLALPPRAQAGQTVWVAVTARRWLQRQLAVLAQSGIHVDRVVPAWAPRGAGLADAPTVVHLHAREGDAPGAAWLVASETEGVSLLPLAGSLARARLTHWQQDGCRISASPAAATIAERWLGQPVAVETEAELALAAAAGDWNLLQFDLAPSHRGLRRLAALWKRWRSPVWRPVRLGLGVLVVVQLLGLNVWAWHQRQTLQQLRDGQEALLRATHPQVRVVRDAALQMHRETATLRDQAGVPGEQDLETLLAAASQAWPEGQAPAAQLRYDGQSLTLNTPAMPPEAIETLRQRLQARGWKLATEGTQLTLQRQGPDAAPTDAPAAAATAAPGPSGLAPAPSDTAQPAAMPPAGPSPGTLPPTTPPNGVPR
ncbi:MAG: hypothetical protein RLY78_3828 [Pseudomonadota bacterium]|jgi:general secretion pathway protein L